MSEAKLFATNGFGGGISVGLRADNYTEFVQLAQEVYGEAEGAVFAADAFATLLKQVPSAAAVGVVNAAVGPVTVTATSGVAAPLPVPGPQATAAAVPAGPPTAAYPGDCPHGVRTWKDTAGKQAGTRWRRWECAIPWSRDAQGRCGNVNA